MINHLTAYRQKRGMSVAFVASKAGVARQSVYAMEAGDFVPNTELALRLAHVLQTRVEDLFVLEEAQTAESATERASLLPGTESLHPGQPVQLCRVGGRVVATAPSPVPWYLPPSDGTIARDPARGDSVRVQLFDTDRKFENRLLVAGCDPGISVLARHAKAAGVELMLAHRNSTQSLELLKQGRIHIAGTHLRDDASELSNVAAVHARFRKKSVAVFSFAVWEEGIVTGIGNPKGIRGIEDLARKDVSIVNREPGAGSRKFLDSQLERLHILANQVRGYDHVAFGHFAAAWQVKTGAVDCCIAIRPAASSLGLFFLPLAAERYDLVLRRRDLDHPSVHPLLDTLHLSSFRRELESLGGYDAKQAGTRVL